MPPNQPQDLSEVHMLGPQTRYVAIRSAVDDQRPWLSAAPVSEQLRAHQIVHLGRMSAFPPLEIVRMHQSGTFFMLTVAGEGEVLVDGAWQRTKPGQGCLLPPHYPNALRAIEGAPEWRFYWVRYFEPDDRIPVAATSRPIIEDFDPQGAAHAFEGILAAVHSDDTPHLIRHWVELIHGYVQCFAGAQRVDSRLHDTWEQVRNNLEASWTLDGLAKRAHVSPEHFRRLCHAHYGRSPARHLAFLRIQHAMELLHTTNDTVFAVSKAVGYASAASFTKAFRHWTGRSPSQLR